MHILRSAGARRVGAIVLVALAGVAGLHRARGASAQGVARGGTAHGPASGAGPVRVLIVGNSYTYVNNLPAVLEGIARSARPARPLEVEMVAVGGATLLQHWRQGAARARIRSGSWDYVVLQEQSLLGATWVDGAPVVSDPERVFLPGVRAFMPEIRAAGARPLLYLTWARRAAPGTQAALTAAYTRAAREHGARLIPAGLVWEEVRRTRPELELFVSDGSHPSPLGTYLAALAFFTTIFDVSPARLAATVRGPAVVDDVVRRDSVVALVALRPDVAAVAQRAAGRIWSALRERGGLPPVQEAASAARSVRLAPGEAVTPAALEGLWTGQLRFYTREMGMGPAQMEMVLASCPGTPVARGRMVLTYAGAQPPDTVTLAQVAARDGIVSFRIPFKHHYTGDILFRGALERTSLEGVAEYSDMASDFRAEGSWDVRRGAATTPPGAEGAAAALCA